METLPEDPDHSMRSLLEETLTYARERDYAGWDLYDGESSRILRALPVDNRWVNLAFQQAVRRAPVNIRPLLLVEQRRNFMGIALFTLANLAAYDLIGEDRYRRDAKELTDWLVENRSVGYSGFCGGHKHPLQTLSRRTMPNTPGIVGTSCAVRALLAADEYFDEGYAEIAETAAAFVFEDLGYSEHPDGARIDYKPDEPSSHYTINANALGARLLVDLYSAAGERRYREGAEGILDYVAARQTDRGGWMYRDPPEASHLTMDNFHNGFVLEAFLRYGEVCDPGRYAETVATGLEFYRDLFGPAGEPHYDESSQYPRDVHSSAQGAIVFSMAGDVELARRIIEWARQSLSDGAGRFFHEKRRFFTKRITLMRWCQAWMAYAIAVYLRRAGAIERRRPPSF